MASVEPILNEIHLWNIFNSVQPNRFGFINSTQLRLALTYGTWSPFKSSTVRYLTVLFGQEHNGMINFGSFVESWNFITRWKNCFRSFVNSNNSGIDKRSWKHALINLKCPLSDSLIDLVFPKLNKMNNNSLTFDEFLQFGILLNILIQLFNKYDSDKDGYITIHFEDFLKIIYSMGVQYC